MPSTGSRLDLEILTHVLVAKISRDTRRMHAEGRVEWEGELATLRIVQGGYAHLES